MDEDPDNMACGKSTNLTQWNTLVSHDFGQGNRARSKRLSKGDVVFVDTRRVLHLERQLFGRVTDCAGGIEAYLPGF
jgi:hypothetical protein